MAEYKGIKGFKVQTVSTDPAASIAATGTWASGGSLNTARAWQAGTGTQTTALSISGETPTKVTNVESYNGSSWTEIADVNTARVGLSGAGTQTASLVAGGFNPPSAIANAESWNGTSWTEVNDLNTARYGISSATLSSTATVAFGGFTGTQPRVANTESWDGTSWTEVNDLNQSRSQLGGSGTQTAALAFGGNSDPPYWSVTETWNGTSWTEVSDLNTARYLNGSGTQTSTLGFGGYTGSASALTEFWDGTSWTEVSDLSTARYTIGGTGADNTSAIAFGGQPGGGVTGATEEWTITATPTTFSKSNPGQVFYNSTSNAFKVTKDNSGVPLGTWASGGNLNTARSQGQGFGATNDTSIASNGYVTTALTNVESYNGTAWTEVTDTSSGHEFSQFGAGTQTAGLVAGGGPSPGSLNSASEEYNGSTWTAGGTLNVARNDNAGNGTQTAALMAGGRPAASYPTGARNAETYDGTSWTSVSDAPPSTAVFVWAMTGVSTASIGVGAAGPSPIFAVYWDGSTWTDITASNSPHYIGGASGSQTNCIVYGGGVPNTANTEFWDGTSWTELNNLSTARDDFGYNSQNSNASSGCLFGGEDPGDVSLNVTEEWTTPAPFATNNTLTAS